MAESSEEVAHLLALLPGLRCVGIGGEWAYSPEAWAAIVPSLSACQDLRLSGEQPCSIPGLCWRQGAMTRFTTCTLSVRLLHVGREVMWRDLRNVKMCCHPPCFRAAGLRGQLAAAAAEGAADAAEPAGSGGVQCHSEGSQGDLLVQQPRGAGACRLTAGLL